METLEQYEKNLHRQLREQGKIWGAFYYKCGECGYEVKMHLQHGVEGPPGHKAQASPFCLKCPKCNSLELQHVEWHRDEKYQFPFRKLKENDSYFKFKPGEKCALPIIKEESDSE